MQLKENNFETFEKNSFKLTYAHFQCENNKVTNLTKYIFNFDFLTLIAYYMKNISIYRERGDDVGDMQIVPEVIYHILLTYKTRIHNLLP